MKTTVELSDDHLLEMKAIAARERRELRDVIEEVVALGLRARRQTLVSADTSRADAEAWLAKWQALGQRIEDNSVDPRSCVEILLSDRL